MNDKIQKVASCGLALALTAAICCGVANAGEKKDLTSKTSEASVVTNDNGSVSRTFVESSITTNGNLVTEHRRETRTNTDMDGNVLQTTTSEYAQSYSVGDVGWKLPAKKLDAKDAPAVATDTFLGLKFGSEFNVSNTVTEAGEPTLLRATFKPAKPLDGFDDYYVYVTPKTHKVVRVCACAKDIVEPNGRGGSRHYLIEALEKRYQTWARLCSWFRPCYIFDVAPDRYVKVCLAGSSDDYETVISAWDDSVARLADDEWEQLREEARKNAAEKRSKRVSDAVNAF